MVAIALLLLLQEPDVVYSLRLTSTRPARVTACLEVAGADDGTNIFTVRSSDPSLTNEADLLRDLRFETREGAPLAPDRSGGSVWIVRHEPHARVRAEWTLVDPIAGVEPPPKLSFNTPPIVRDDLFCVVALTGLLRARRPDPRNVGEHDHDERPARLELVGFLEHGWSIATTLGDGARLETTAGKLREAIVVAGRLEVEDVAVGPRWLRIVRAGDLAGPDPAAAIDLITRTSAAAIEGFDDRSMARNLAVVLASGAGADESLEGVAIDGGYVVRVPAGFDAAPGSRGARRLAVVVAHETYHLWNGHVIRPGALDREVAWFTEGVTDHCSRRLLLRSGIWSPQEYVDDVNRALVDYFTNPGRGAAAHVAEAKRHADDDYAAIPYELGDFAGLLLDRRIRRESGGARTIDDFMRELFLRAQRSRRGVTNDFLLGAIAEFTSIDFAAQMRALVADGRELPPDPADFGSFLRLVTKEVQARDGATATTIPQVELGRGSVEALRAGL